MTNEIAHMAEEADAGERLDRFLARRMEVGLRAARRMIEVGRVRVSDTSRTSSWKLRPGDTVLVAADAPCSGAPLQGAGEGCPELSPGDVKVLARSANFVALFKPSGLNTAALAGGGGASLEALLPSLLPDIQPGAEAQLVNRLDRDTSGIVLAAFGAENVRAFRTLEDAGRVDKRYFALAAGHIEAPVTLAWSLDTAGRARVKVLDAPTADPLRVTRVTPVARFADATLVEARIAKGARHQIRAHLSRAGHPILGDGLYGGPPCAGLKLHHWKCSFPGFSASCPHLWEDRPDVRDAAAAYATSMEDSPCAS